jgi:hypothetical protein
MGEQQSIKPHTRNQRGFYDGERLGGLMDHFSPFLFMEEGW